MGGTGSVMDKLDEVSRRALSRLGDSRGASGSGVSDPRFLVDVAASGRRASRPLGEFAAHDLSSLTAAFDRSTDELSAPPFILLDDSPIRVTWDLCMATLIVFYVFVVPLRVSFGKTSTGHFIEASGGW